MEIQKIQPQSSTGSRAAPDPHEVRFLKPDPKLDPDSGRKILSTRTYDPSIGRFLQVDPDPGKLSNPISVNNAYAYTQNSPGRLTDPSGKFPLLIAMAVAGIIGGAMNAYNHRGGGNTLMAFVDGAAIAMGSVLATAFGAGLATFAAGAMGITVAAGSIGGVLAGAVGGAAMNTAFYWSLGARGADLAVAGMA